MVATQIFFIFTPKPGEIIQFDEHIFQRGWNHQLDSFYCFLLSKADSHVQLFWVFFPGTKLHNCFVIRPPDGSRKVASIMAIRESALRQRLGLKKNKHETLTKLVGMVNGPWVSHLFLQVSPMQSVLNHRVCVVIGQQLAIWMDHGNATYQKPRFAVVLEGGWQELGQWWWRFFW